MSYSLWFLIYSGFTFIVHFNKSWHVDYAKFLKTLKSEEYRLQRTYAKERLDFLSNVAEICKLWGQVFYNSLTNSSL